MKVLLVEPFFAGSHRQWAEGLQRHSRHCIQLHTLPGRHWKWRMFGGAVALAETAQSDAFAPDLLLATDMLDVSTYLALSRNRHLGLPVALYFHENQITYPWSSQDQPGHSEPNRQYGFINYTSALAADRLFFNSHYHRSAFLTGLRDFLKGFPDRRGLWRLESLERKSTVLPLGLDLKSLEVTVEEAEQPREAVILWNHRWEYDKDPDTFFNLLIRLQREGYPFRLIVLGEAYGRTPPIFSRAREVLRDRILHFGYVANRLEYARRLQMADLLPVTSRQDFFGASAVEAIYCGCYPLLPNRLAFPEHLPPEERRKHIYTDEEDLYHRLRSAISRITELRAASAKYRNFVSSYDWRILVRRYDDALSAMLE